MRRVLIPVGALSMALLGCGGGERAEGDAVAPISGIEAAGSAAAAGHPDRFSLGRPVDATTLRTLDRDVGAEGVELPAGNGSVGVGRALYAAQCAVCHGANGQGMPPAFPALSGRDPKAEDFQFASDPKLVHTIGNYWPHATTLFDYIRRAMPLTAPGSLTDDQVYSLTAYLLAVDGILPDTATLDAARLRDVRMPYHDRFVPDDRRPSKENQ